MNAMVIATKVVSMGGGCPGNAPEYSGDDMSSYRTLACLQYGAKLYRQLGAA